MLSDINSTWEQHRDELMGFCIRCSITLQQLMDAAYHRMNELTDEQREDLKRVAIQFLIED